VSSLDDVDVSFGWNCFTYPETKTGFWYNGVASSSSSGGLTLDSCTFWRTLDDLPTGKMDFLVAVAVAVVGGDVDDVDAVFDFGEKNFAILRCPWMGASVLPPPLLPAMINDDDDGQLPPVSVLLVWCVVSFSAFPFLREALEQDRKNE
jgi:hypothetical protein